MSLSQRLKQAETERRRAAGLPDEPTSPTTERSGAVVDITASDTTGNVIDLTDRTPSDPASGITYDPVRNGDATHAFGDADPVVPGRLSNYRCPKCGSRTQVDLIDQVHQTISLSCLSCFHMFRVQELP